MPASDIKEILADEDNPDLRRKLKQEYKEERKKYSSIKNARWSILTNSRNLKGSKKSALDTILEEHNDLAVCYAMKEEMCRLFELSDPDIARQRWIAWFTSRPFLLFALLYDIENSNFT